MSRLLSQDPVVGWTISWSGNAREAGISSIGSADTFGSRDSGGGGGRGRVALTTHFSDAGKLKRSFGMPAAPEISDCRAERITPRSAQPLALFAPLFIKEILWARIRGAWNRFSFLAFGSAIFIETLSCSRRVAENRGYFICSEAASSG